MTADRDVPAVFVYGTLRPGERNWHHLEPFAARTEPATLPDHRLYLLEYPCAVGIASTDVNMSLTSGERAAVAGDLVWLRPTDRDRAVAHLDWFEDFRADDPDGSLYVRELAAVLTASIPRVACWVYLAGTAQRERLRPDDEIAGGEWRSRWR